jgi:hypothetical protein
MAKLTLVGLNIQEPVQTGGAAFGTVKLSGPAPAGLTIPVTSSNPNILGVDNSPVGIGEGETESFLIILSPERPGTVVLTAALGNSVQAKVTVEKDPKEGKEGKENSEKGKDQTGKDLERWLRPDEADRLIRAYGSSAMMAVLTAAGNVDSEGQTGNGRAFIRSDERPALRLPVDPDKKRSADAGDRCQPL